MDYLKDEDVWPLDTIVRLKKTHEFARIVSHTWLRPEIPRYFLHYSVEIEDRGVHGAYCLAKRISNVFRLINSSGQGYGTP